VTFGTAPLSVVDAPDRFPLPVAGIDPSASGLAALPAMA